MTTRKICMAFVCLALVTCFTSGFVPKGSFVQRTSFNALSFGFSNRSPIKRNVVRNSALSMNLFDRFARVAKANLNNVLKTMEEPEKILNQAIEDMQVSVLSLSILAIS
jgi:hypothetical protein